MLQSFSRVSDNDALTLKLFLALVTNPIVNISSANTTVLFLPDFQLEHTS